MLTFFPKWAESIDLTGRVLRTLVK